MATSRRLFIVMLGMLVAACSSLPSADTEDVMEFDLPRDADGVEAWDLREPPTASAVGLSGEHDEAVYSSVDPRLVRVLLPDGLSIEADVTTVSFDNHLSEDGEVDPSSLILHGANRPFDEALASFETSLEQLDLRRDAAATWEDDVTTADSDTVRVGASRVIDYLEASVGGRYKSLSGNASLTWTFGWSETTMDRARSDASTSSSSE